MKKRGFTLIELLAVIVVLAIIALIATPIVMNLIKNAGKGAAERSAERYLDAVETAIAADRLNNPLIEDGTYLVDNNGNLCLQGKTCTEPDLTVEINGNKPEAGSTIVIAGGQVVSSGTSMTIDDYTVTVDDKGKAEAETEDDDTELPEISDLIDGKYTVVAISDDNFGEGFFQVLDENNEVVACNSFNYGFKNGMTVEQYIDNRSDLNVVRVNDTNDQANWDTTKRYGVGDPILNITSPDTSNCTLLIEYNEFYEYEQDVSNPELGSWQNKGYFTIDNINSSDISNIGVLKSE